MNDLVHLAVSTAVILCRGLGKRMRANSSNTGAMLDQATAEIAESGVKALIAIDRPFLDYVLHDLAEAGVYDVVLVIGPEHHALRQYYSTLPTKRIRITFAIQLQPRGTADAVAAAQQAVGTRPFLVINSDNLYPASALKPLAASGVPGLVGFHRSGLLTGNIPADRVAKFAVIRTNGQNYLESIIEKPTVEQLTAIGIDPMISMNCWSFDQRIFAACAAIAPSPCGELELPDAVIKSMDDGVRYRIVERFEPVLDLSSRDDIATVRTALANHDVQL